MPRLGPGPNTYYRKSRVKQGGGDNDVTKYSVTNYHMVYSLEHRIDRQSRLGKLHLKVITLNAQNAKYKSKYFPAVIMRIKEPKAIILIFATGKVVLIGVKIENEFKFSVWKNARIVQKLHFSGVKFKERSSSYTILEYKLTVDVKFWRVVGNERLNKLRDDIKGKVEGAEGEGYRKKLDISKWIEDVSKLKNDWELMPESIAVAKKSPLKHTTSEINFSSYKDTKMKVYTMDEDEYLHLFVKKLRDKATLEHIQPFTKKIARECHGLPLAISVIGASMRGKTRVRIWKDALKSHRMSEPHNKDIKDKIYKVIKWDCDSLESL
ncbi:hypothetical protein CQW23_18933 [Capsicum baccatum]|uniref:Uncharacterized protein n=1 Tax=Capsicum baccatum TaxID=33114 RepID=A0A2G2W4G0_CAPBA|nr:hypothetical protein CQW23_18933 [Capsicum baccatum]